MEPKKASSTALMVAWRRARHLTDQGPKFFEDSITQQLGTTSVDASLEAAYIRNLKEFFPASATWRTDDHTLAKIVIRNSAALAEILLRAREHLSPEAINTTYFEGRTEGTRACEHAHFIHAVVAEE